MEVNKEPEESLGRMYISELRLWNFKSFGKELVVIPFDKGLNVITGHCGSGRTNVLKAIMFGLAQDRFQFDEKLLVHQEGDSAEVSVVLGDSAILTRSIFSTKKGWSYQYLLNGRPSDERGFRKLVRREDIHILTRNDMRDIMGNVRIPFQNLNGTYPSIILLDEIDSYLDTSKAGELANALEEMSRETQIISVYSHKEQVANRVIRVTWAKEGSHIEVC